MIVSVPISSLTNYNAVLSEVDNGKEVILTKNGHSKYAVVDVKTWQYTVSMLRFLSDMKAVDEEMANGGARYSPKELLNELGIE
ncbi:MAG: prevent-host-death protein [Coriobacteriia bacterium]|nr:prevent-host-death protein [Coriobacteriia bacterium]